MRTVLGLSMDAAAEVRFSTEFETKLRQETRGTQLLLERQADHYIM